MLVDTPQIVWHGGEAGKNAPVLSVDAHPLLLIQTSDKAQGGFRGRRFVLATAGTDAEVRLWTIRQPAEEDEKSWDKVDTSGRLQSFVASLEGHQRGVNVVRFSPDGLSLASASDGGTVVVWRVGDVTAWSKLSSDRETHKVVLRAANEDIYDLSWSPDSKYIACGSIDRRAHVWEVMTKRSIATLEDHANYVQGTAWDPLYKYLATQSSDRSCRVYQLSHQSGQGGGDGKLGLIRFTMRCSSSIKSCAIAINETGQESSAGGDASRVPVLERTNKSVTSERFGVDIEGSGAATNSKQTEIEGMFSKRESSLFSVGAKDDADCGVFRGASGRTGDEGTPINGASGVNAGGTKGKFKSAQRKNLFVDETVTSFFRRLAWSPDGAFLITPTAQGWDAATGKAQFCTYLFRREQFDKPAVCLPGLSKPSVAVRCNPRLFALKASKDKDDGMLETSSSMCDLPYRVVFAVVSLDAVVVYDTEHSHPLTVATGLHYSGLTDACWSPDGQSLFVSSSDGYVSKIHFAEGELGVLIPESDVPSQTKRLHPIIYGEEQVSGRISTFDSSAVGEGGQTTGNAPARSVVEDDYEGSLGAAQSTAPSPALAPRQKRKIAPTLVKSWANAADEGRDAVDDAKQPSTPATRNETGFSTLIGSSSPSSGSRPSEKKRRIVPTLVCSDVTTARILDANQGVVGNAASTQEITSPSGDDVAAGDMQQERTPKRRLTPTLVSSL